MTEEIAYLLGVAMYVALVLLGLALKVVVIVWVLRFMGVTI